MPSKELEKNKLKKIFILFILILFCVLLLLASLADTAEKPRHLPSLKSEKKDLAIRGDIISSDNFKISSSIKLYKASIDTRFLNPKKLDIFIKLFGIYSGISTQIIRNKIQNMRRKGTLILSYNIDSKTAKNLKELGFKLRRLGVFQARKIGDDKITIGLNIHESGEKRIFSYKNTLTPVIGYIKKFETKDGITRVKGVKGLEKYYNYYLQDTRDGILKGERDVLSYISFNKNSLIVNRKDGDNLILNIPLRLQRNIEILLDKYKKKYDASEVIACVMESETGKILSLASSNRFNPDDISKKDIPYLNVNAIEYQFEPGSVVKPITMALLLDEKKIKRDDLVYAYNKGRKDKYGKYPKGSYKIAGFTIHDDHQFKKHFLTLDDIIMYSSNIGMLQLAQKLDGEEFANGFKKFGLMKKTGIDLPYEKIGFIPINKLYGKNSDQNGNVYKATVSYGQGMTTTFMQLMQAYTTFNNNGFMIRPKLVSKILDDKGKIVHDFDKEVGVRTIKRQTASTIKNMLIKTVEFGTARDARIQGLEIGGKTGTAQIARKGAYQKQYISSIFGFVNDKKSKYTVGVTIFKPLSTGKHWYYYYASHSAVPIFKQIVNTLTRLRYLKKENPQSGVN